jgi:hypothetical protein
MVAIVEALSSILVRSGQVCQHLAGPLYLHQNADAPLPAVASRSCYFKSPSWRASNTLLLIAIEIAPARDVPMAIASASMSSSSTGSNVSEIAVFLPRKALFGFDGCSIAAATKASAAAWDTEAGEFFAGLVIAI